MSGTFVLSLDTEIAWGTYANLSQRTQTFDNYRRLLLRLRRQLDIFEISATWAVVGGLLHPDGPRSPLLDVQYSFATTTERERINSHPTAWFYQPGLIDIVLAARAPQEIASHTMTHLLATDPAVTRTMFEAQLAAVVQAHAEAGLPAPRSLVYPQNRIAHTDLLPQYGFRSYRGVEQSAYTHLPPWASRPAHLLNRALAVPPPTYAPVQQPGTPLNLPASQFLMAYDGIRAKIPTAARVHQARRGLNRAIQRGEIYHLWFHPFNLGSSDEMLDAFTQILALVYQDREQGTLRVQTMQQVAADLR